MHEMSLAEGVLRIVDEHARAAGSDKVLVVRLEIGALSHVEPAAMEFAFQAVTQGSLAEGARLEIGRAPGRAWCHDCASSVEIAALGAPCPDCGGYKLQVTGGNEMRVKDMEVA